MSQMKGSGVSTEFLDSMSSAASSDLRATHGVSSSASPYVSTTKNPVVAEFFAKGPSGTQSGVVTTFRVETREAALLQKQAKLVANFENPMAFFEPHPLIGLPESEYLFIDEIDSRYIYTNRGVK